MAYVHLNSSVPRFLSFYFLVYYSLLGVTVSLIELHNAISSRFVFLQVRTGRGSTLLKCVQPSSVL